MRPWMTCRPSGRSETASGARVVPAVTRCRAVGCVVGRTASRRSARPLLMSGSCQIARTPSLHPDTERGANRRNRRPSTRSDQPRSTPDRICKPEVAGSIELRPSSLLFTPDDRDALERTRADARRRLRCLSLIPKVAMASRTTLASGERTLSRRGLTSRGRGYDVRRHRGVRAVPGKQCMGDGLYGALEARRVTPLNLCAER